MRKQLIQLPQQNNLTEKLISHLKPRIDNLILVTTDNTKWVKRICKLNWHLKSQK